MFPVVSNQRLIGCVTTREAKEAPPDEWNRRTVEDIMQPCSTENSIGVNDDATKALSVMYQTGNSRLMVIEKSELVGVIALKDLLQFFSLKMDLELE